MFFFQTLYQNMRFRVSSMKTTAQQVMRYFDDHIKIVLPFVFQFQCERITRTKTKKKTNRQQRKVCRFFFYFCHFYPVNRVTLNASLAKGQKTTFHFPLMCFMQEFAASDLNLWLYLCSYFRFFSLVNEKNRSIALQQHTKHWMKCFGLVLALQINTRY